MLVKFGNNWIQKIPRTAKLDEAVFPNWTACSPITYTNQGGLCGTFTLKKIKTIIK